MSTGFFCSRLAIIVPTFHPPLALRERLRLLAPMVERILVVEDGSAPSTAEVLGPSTPHNLDLIVLNQNRGIAVAINCGLSRLESTGVVDAVLTLDHDSEIHPWQLEALYVAYLQAKLSNPAIGCIGPGRMSGVAYERYPRGDLAVTAEIMQSGSIFSMSALKSVGPFLEALFIDCVDTEMCLRLRRAGFVVYVVPSIDLTHTLGSGRSLSFLGRKVFVTDHSTTRRYLITRNRVGLILAYWQYEPRWALRTIRRLIVNTTLGVTVELDRKPKIAAVLKGLFDSRNVWRSIVRRMNGGQNW